MREWLGATRDPRAKAVFAHGGSESLASPNQTPPSTRSTLWEAPTSEQVFEGFVSKLCQLPRGTEARRQGEASGTLVRVRFRGARESREATGRAQPGTDSGSGQEAAGCCQAGR